MHLTLKKEATRPPGMNSLQQQARFDDFVQEFNTERPHEALAMKCPAEIYSASSRPYSGLPDLTYPLHDRDVLVTACGRDRSERARPIAELSRFRLARGFVARISSRAKSAPRIHFHLRRTYSGRPSSSMRFSDTTAMASSVVCRPSVRERSASPITRL